ncbi:MAG: glycosyltransferase family 4 protein [Desulfovibrionaceae bacterium]|nr:glycosyltransferase family 4 protein [Desulfovibrionaceae bacterium]
MPKKQRIWGTLDPFFQGGPVMGRIVANTAFLTALLAADIFDEYHFFLPDQKAMDALGKNLKRVAPGPARDKRFRIMPRRELPAMLRATAYHCFHLSDCIANQPFLARARNLYSANIFPVTGVIHSLSYARYPEAFLRHLWPGTTARDCIVCTSGDGRMAVEHHFARLREGFGLTGASHPAPVLAEIPLAVDTDALAPGKPNPDGPVRLLAFGRISHTSKMDLVPLVRALHRLVQDGLDPASVELVLAGWDDSRSVHYLDTLKHLAQNASIPLTVELRPSEAEKRKLFQSADIFVSIADNPQETFGITLAEAGAFGLPVVASRYDGYKDIVAHGETGLLVPTTVPERTPNLDAMATLLFDSEYHLGLAQQTAVSVPDLAEALRALIQSPELRRAMGAAARKRVESAFSWPSVIARYVALWDDLWRADADPGPLRDIPHPLAPDYGRLFGHYGSRVPSAGLRFKTGRTGEAFYRDRDYPNLYAGLHDAIDLDVVRKIAFFARKPVDSATLISKVSGMAPHLHDTQVEYHILWALKQDILQTEEQ